MIQLRAATEQDIPSLLEIYNDAILNTTAVYSYDPVTLAERLAWFRAKQQKKLPVLVAEQSTGIVGFSTYGPFRAWDAYQYTVENSVYVHPDCRGQGIGKQLLSALIEQAKIAKIHAMVAGIDATNAASIGLHSQFDFVQVAHFREIGYKFDRWLDLVFMERLL
ncbi:N-acetyltransferase [Romeria aff. gracilis LEGE 07310]|uniref:N-acetyltransferase n=1 Tax=Vasconcelosia minhoensis LEGE 07310 TaxID=915328 RepID=A0A8J7DNV9_9CYAN|nr:GNAT family N-acetyltransferase [Romeria gracilis]MBE9080271.1 N-acetyltransferase [Romeria aff. gracilis LEGE 07310]